MKGCIMGNEKKSARMFESVLFVKIFRTFRIAIHPGKLMIAFSALAIICLAGLIMDTNKTVIATPDIDNQQTELHLYIASPDQVPAYLETHEENEQRNGVFSTLWYFGTVRFHRALNCLFAFDLPAVAANIADCFKAVVWALRYHFFYSIIFFAINLAVIAIAGGAICRMSALQFAHGEKPALTTSLRFSIKRFTSFFTAPLAPVVIIIVLGLFIFLLGLVGNIPWLGELIMAVCMVLALIVGALIAVLSIGAVAGFGLMFPAVAYDGSDCFDAISRSLNYVYSRPWRMGFYTAVAAVYGAICYIFVRLFAFLLLWFTHRFLQFGVLVDSSSKEVNKLIAIWPQPSFTDLIGPSGSIPTNWSESLAGFVTYVFLLVVVGLVVSFVISFYFSANTIIYSLMRNKVDDTAIEDIYTDTSDVEAADAEDSCDNSKPQSKSKTDDEQPPEDNV